MTLDLNARYRVNGMPGVAFYLRGYYTEFELDTAAEDWEEVEVPGFVRAVMVGDDREHIVDVDDLVPLTEDEYCSVCGQIGCGHNF